MAKFKVGDLVRFCAASYVDAPMIIIKVSDAHGWGDERSYLIHMQATNQRRWATEGLIKPLTSS